MRRTAILGLTLLGLGACAGSDDSGAAGTAETAAAPAAAPEVHFTAKDFTFEGPDSVASGWTTVVLHNDGPSLHHLMLLRLEEGKTMEDLVAAFEQMGPTDMPPMWAVPAGGVNPPDPGADTRATLNMAAGNYAIVCIVDIPGHVPHIMKGMMKGLTVTPSTGAAAPEPTADVTLTEVDFSYSLSTPLTAGRHVVKILNEGTQPHEFELVRLADGKTLDDLMAWGATAEGDLPGSSLGGAAPMMPGDVQYVSLDLAPGNYVILCFVPDPMKEGMVHAAEGMLLPLTIS